MSISLYRIFKDFHFFWFQHPFSWKFLWSNIQHPPWVPLVLQGVAAFLLGDHLNVQDYQIYQVPFYQLQWQKFKTWLPQYFDSCCLFALHTPPKNRECTPSHFWPFITSYLRFSYYTSKQSVVWSAKYLQGPPDTAGSAFPQLIFTETWPSNERTVTICAKWFHHGGHSCSAKFFVIPPDGLRILCSQEIVPGQQKVIVTFSASQLNWATKKKTLLLSIKLVV